MKKILTMENLDCANCAAKMERGIAAIEGVRSVTVSFFAQKTVVETEEGSDWERIKKEIAKAVGKVDSDCRVLF